MLAPLSPPLTKGQGQTAPFNCPRAQVLSDARVNALSTIIRIVAATDNSKSKDHAVKLL